MAAIKEWPARRCSGDSCRQGRAECKTPQACEVPEGEDSGAGIVLGVLYGLLAWLAVALCFVVVTLGTA
jgi:hypothetical protein